MSALRTIQCYHCRRRFEAPRRALSTSCPGCSKPLVVEDVVIKTAHSVRKIQTCGRLIVQKKGRVMAGIIEAHAGVEVEGILEGNVVSGGLVRIGPKAQWKGDCRAPRLAVELGACIARGFFSVPEDALGVSDLAAEAE
ncbi:MAG: polymer-forming cytoskeletal protein [Phycisphaerae bacterium]|nr:polymer-forming cytoskeletal protein [Phycisphaerae bacterium]